MEVYNTDLRKGNTEEGVEFQLDTHLQRMTFCKAPTVPPGAPLQKRVSNMFAHGNSCSVWGRHLPRPQGSSPVHSVLVWGPVRAAMGFRNHQL